MLKEVYKFFWPIVKPYKWWFLLMTIAPITSNALGLAFNYSIKLLIDMTATHNHITFNMALKPFLYLLSGLFIMEFFWFVQDLANLKIKPIFCKDITNKIFAHILRHDYNYFINTPSGSIIGKIKGVADGWWNLWEFIEHKITEPLSRTLIFSATLIFINIKLYLIVIIFFIIVFPISYILYSTSAKLALLSIDR